VRIKLPFGTHRSLSEGSMAHRALDAFHARGFLTETEAAHVPQ